MANNARLPSEVAWRVAAMRADLDRKLRPGQQFLMARPEREFLNDWPATGRCFSCGEQLRRNQNVRCRLCATAAELVLSEAYEGVEINGGGRIG